MTEKFMNRFLGYVIGFCLLLLLIVAILNHKAQSDSEALLRQSVSSQLTAICVAAREAIDIPKFLELNEEADTQNNPDYATTLQKFRHIADGAGAKYIYVLKQIGDKYYFVYDTDPVSADIFGAYDISPVHMEAFKGKVAADFMNVKDSFGSFSTGAVPLWRGGKVVGIVSADIEDTLLAENRAKAKLNTQLLIGAILATMAAMILVLRNLLMQIKDMQDRLAKLAHYDTVTGLPNRLYLLEYLEELKKQETQVPFALCFIDLDNFKKVNDVAGHDAGDELLRHIGAYLGRHPGEHKASRVFRPAAGKLNVAARVGGDEFVIVIPHVDSVESASSVVSDILDGFRKEAIDEHIQKFNVGMSIGVALYPSQSEDYNVIIKYADIAMYHAKNSGKDTFRIYNDELAPKAEK